MARRIRNANPVTLFPFLAVLMCTIGALVLLLVVISAQIRGSAVQHFVAEHQKNAEPARSVAALPSATEETQVEEPAADPEPVSVESVVVEVQELEPVASPDPPVARIPPPVPASDEQLATIEALKSQAVALKSKFADAVEELDGLTQKRSALDRQLKTVVAQEADLKKSLQRAIAVSTVAGQKLASLNVENRQIIELLEQSDELIKSERKRVSTPRHSLIPYDGQTGTIRKPIVIECAAGTIRFEAEDVELDVKRLEEYPPGVNPLVAGLQTLFAYWTEQARAEGESGIAAQPYALLIVRPSGASQFQLARVLLQPLVGNYGYEFVEESFAYDVPLTTDEAARKCREAVETAFRMKPRGVGVGSPGLHPGAPGDSTGGLAIPHGPIDVERLTQQPAASRGFFSSGNFRRRLTGAAPTEGAGGSSIVGDGFELSSKGPPQSPTVEEEEESVIAPKRWGQSDPNATLGLERPVTIVVGQSHVLIVGAYQITPKPGWSELQTVNVCLKGLDMTASNWGLPSEKFYWVPVVTLRVEDGSESLGQLLEKSLERLGVVVEHEPTFLDTGRRD